MSERIEEVKKKAMEWQRAMLEGNTEEVVMQIFEECLDAAYNAGRRDESQEIFEEMVMQDMEKPKVVTNGERLMEMVGPDLILTDGAPAEGWVDVVIDEEWWNTPCDPVEAEEAAMEEEA